MSIYMEYRTTQMSDGVFGITDEGNSSFYIIEGQDKALVIDTGISPNREIMPEIRKLTQKPVVLALTHAHIDHMYHMDEFESVYMCHRELTMPTDFLKYMMGGKELRLNDTIDVTTGSVIDVGGNSVEAFLVPGHTPGSVVFLEKEHGFVFSGDAIGGGSGVWLQLPGTVPLEEYYASLMEMRSWLVNLRRPLCFFTGHNFQQFQSTLISNYNPVSIGLISDLIDLTYKVVNGEIVGRLSDADKTFSLEPTLYASYGRAELYYKRSSF